MKNKHWLIIADGEPLPKETTKNLAASKKIIALDGALKVCLDYDIIPAICMGDFDSIDDDLMAYAKENYSIEFIKNTCQNSTDLEKALIYLETIKSESITICHATGWRLDHSLYNLRLLQRFHQKFNSLVLMTQLEKVYFIKDQTITLSGSKNDALALLSFPEARITSSGLKYDMNNFQLKHGVSESTSNALENETAIIDVQGEVLLLISHQTQIRFNINSSRNY